MKNEKDDPYRKKEELPTDLLLIVKLYDFSYYFDQKL